MQFSFNDGRSRSTWQGFSTQWYCCAEGSVGEDPSLLLALQNSLILGAATVLVATPLGVMLAMGLTRWRSRSSKVANGIALVPLVTPEIVVGSALYLVMVNLYQFVPLGRPAMLLGHVTFSVSYVLVIVRSRLLAIGGDYEEAGQDLGASPLQAIRTILIPLLMPSIFASAMLVFATSLDDFVVSQFLFGERLERHRPHQAVQRRPLGPDAGAQRPGHAAARGVVPGPDPRVRRPAGAAAGRAVGARGPRRLRLIVTDDGSAVRGERGRRLVGRGQHPERLRRQVDGDGLPGGQAVASRVVRDQRLQHRTVRETDHHLGRRPQEDGAVDHAREPVGPGEAGLLHLDALRTDHCPACRRVVAGRSLRLEGEVAVPNRAGRRAAREALDVQQVGDAQEVRDELGQRFLVDLLRCPELDDPATGP